MRHTWEVISIAARRASRSRCNVIPKVILTENTVIGEHQVIPEKYRAYFKQSIEGFSPEVFCGDYKYWLNACNGKTLGEAKSDYYEYQKQKSMKDRLSEERFNIISEPDKTFILAFDEEINKLGYSFGGNIGWGACWGIYMIIYSKGGIKGKQVTSRIFIREGSIILRLFFNNIDKHSDYIENTPHYIKNVFTGTHGNCSCNPKKENCGFRKIYTIDGRQIEKCSGIVFEFHQPDLDKLPGYAGLLKEFYPVKVK